MTSPVYSMLDFSFFLSLFFINFRLLIHLLGYMPVRDLCMLWINSSFPENFFFVSYGYVIMAVYEACVLNRIWNRY